MCDCRLFYWAFVTPSLAHVRGERVCGPLRSLVLSRTLGGYPVTLCVSVVTGVQTVLGCGNRTFWQAVYGSVPQPREGV